MAVNPVRANLYNEDIPDPEAILSSLPFILQGLGTGEFRWQGLVLIPPEVVSLPDIALLGIISECGLLFKRISSRLGVKQQSVVIQALYEAIGQDIDVYLGEVSALEKRIRNEDPKISLVYSITLFETSVINLRLFDTIVCACEQRTGSQVLSFLHSLTFSGDSAEAKVSQRLLECSFAPYEEILRVWRTTGTVSDPFEEFFVIVSPEEIWADRFVLAREHIPSCISQEDAENAFELGKTVYFLVALCGDLSLRLELGQNKDASEEHELVMSRVHSALNKLDLDAHLRALEGYLLLTKGDFAQVLLSEAAEALFQPAHRVLLHQITTVLEIAISMSTAKFDGDNILHRLDARMLELGHGEQSWQVFTLEYHLDSPLDVLIDSGATRKYLQIFNMLWNLRWASYALKTAWKRVTLGNRGKFGIQVAKYGVQDMWKHCRQTLQLMSLFHTELLQYIYFEVIQAGSRELHRALAKPTSVEDVTRSVHANLDSIIKRALFGGDEISVILHSLVKLALLFRTALDDLYVMTVKGMVEDARFEFLYQRILELRQGFTENVSLLLRKVDQQDEAVRSFLLRVRVCL